MIDLYIHFLRDDSWFKYGTYSKEKLVEFLPRFIGSLDYDEIEVVIMKGDNSK